MLPIPSSWRHGVKKSGGTVSFSAEANYGDFRKEWTPNFSGLISNTWDTSIGRFGLLVSGAYSQIKSRACTEWIAYKLQPHSGSSLAR